MINFFISSTFTDMHHERDWMHREVFPALSEEAFQYGENIGIRDLRWGIHTDDALSAEEADEHVLLSCLDEIDICRPYMIVLIGNRYGSKFRRELLEDIIRKKLPLPAAEDNTLSLPDDIMELSITEMEIRYGAMQLHKSKDAPKIIFYIRKLEGDNVPAKYAGTDEDQKNINRLIKLAEEWKARDSNQGNIILWHDRVNWNTTDNSPDNRSRFISQMIRHILQLLQREWETAKALTDYQRERIQHESFAKKNSEEFFFRAKVLRMIRERLTACQTDFTAIQGEPGTGKTSIMSYIAAHPASISPDISAASNIAVLPLFCGYTPMTCQTVGLMRHMITFIEEQTVGKEPAALENELEELRARLDRSIRAFDRQARESGRTILILIDSIEQLDTTKVRDNLLFLPRNLPASVQVIVSCVKQFDLSFWKDSVLDIHGLDDGSEVGEMLNTMLASYGKKAEKPLIDTIKKKPRSNNPLYLSLLVQRLVMMSREDFEIINQMEQENRYDKASVLYRKQLIENCPDELNAMCRYILDTASEQIGGELPQQIVQYISASRHGFRETDLEHIFQIDGTCRERWNTLSFSRFYRYMRNLFIIREDGRYDFSHLSIREGFCELSIHSESIPDAVYIAGESSDNSDEINRLTYLHRKILEHLKNLPLSDPLRMNEFVFHCRYADEKDALIEYLCSISSESADIAGTVRIQLSEAAARGIYEICTESPESRDWFCDVLKKCSPWEHPDETTELLRFILHFLPKAFEASFHELDTQKSIYERCLKLADSLRQEKDDEAASRILADACYQLGNICHRQGGILNYSQALGLYLREERITDTLPDHKTADTSSLCQRWIRNSTSLSHLGDIYADMDGHENRSRALRSYMKSKEILLRLLRPDNHGNIDSLKTELQHICQKTGSLLASNGWKGCREACGVYKEAGEIVSQSPHSYKREQVSLNLRFGDMLLDRHNKEDARRALTDYYQKAEELTVSMRGEPPKTEHELIWLLCRERVLYTKILLGEITAPEDIADRYHVILKILDTFIPEDSEIPQDAQDTAYARYLSWVYSVFSEHAAGFVLKAGVLADTDLKRASQLLIRAEENLERLCKSDNRYRYRQDLAAIHCQRADILLQIKKKDTEFLDRTVSKNKNNSADQKIPDKKALDKKILDYYSAALTETRQLLAESNTPEARHDYLAILTKLGDLYLHSGLFRKKAEEYYMLALEEAISLDKESKSIKSMMDVSLLCGRIAQVCEYKPAAESMAKRSALLKSHVQRLAKQDYFPENNFELHCRHIPLHF